MTDALQFEMKKFLIVVVILILLVIFGFWYRNNG